MLKFDTIDVQLTNRNKTYYYSKGYDISENVITVKISDLPKNSHIKIDVICDRCNKEYKLMYSKYIQNISKYSFFTCKKCSYEKKKMTNLERFGVENYAKLENYGDIVKKIKKEKYGHENYNNIEKHRKTCLNKYGKESFLYFSGEYKIQWIQAYRKNLLKKLKKRNVIDITENGNYIMLCEKGHLFEIDNSTFSNRNREKNKNILCTICNPIGSHTQSGMELKLKEFIEKNYTKEILQNYKIKGKEIDIYLPDINIGIEFNGIYWHNDIYKSVNYHYNKTELAEKQGIKLIHVYQDDWLYKENIIKSNILKTINEKIKIIDLDNFDIKEIKDIKKFINKNSLDDYFKSDINIGLYYKNKLLSTMSFIKKEKDKYVLINMCEKLYSNVKNGYNKIFDYFIKKYNPVEVLSYVNRSWPINDFFDKQGFKLISKTKPTCYKIVKGVRYINDNDNRYNKIHDSGKLELIFKTNS